LGALRGEESYFFGAMCFVVSPIIMWVVSPIIIFDESFIIIMWDDVSAAGVEAAFSPFEHPPMARTAMTNARRFMRTPCKRVSKNKEGGARGET
jgi:hypothetical protein